MNIPLSPEIQQALSQAAQQQGTTPELLAESYVRASLPPSALNPGPSDAKNLLEFLGDLVGCVDSSTIVPGGANMSEETGKKFGEHLMQRHEGGPR